MRIQLCSVEHEHDNIQRSIYELKAKIMKWRANIMENSGNHELYSVISEYGIFVFQWAVLLWSSV